MKRSPVAGTNFPRNCFSTSWPVRQRYPCRTGRTFKRRKLIEANRRFRPPFNRQGGWAQLVNCLNDRGLNAKVRTQLFFSRQLQGSRRDGLATDRCWTPRGHAIRAIFTDKRCARYVQCSTIGVERGSQRVIHGDIDESGQETWKKRKMCCVTVS